MILIKLFAILVWTVVGFLIWIPLLIRSIAAYTVGVTAAIIAGNKTIGMARILPDAITFYAGGFRRISESFDETTDTSFRRIHLPRVLAECAWAILVWGSLVYSGIRLYYHFIAEHHFILVIRNNTDLDRLQFSLSSERDDHWDWDYLFTAKSYHNCEVRRTTPGILYDGSVREGDQKRILVLRAADIVGRAVTDKDWSEAPTYSFFMSDASSIGLNPDRR